MSRQATIATDDIVKAAREVFLRQGIKATTAEVAKRAGVSEGSIFVRFRTKQELFYAAMQAERDENWLWMLEGAEARPVVDMLTEAAAAIIACSRRILPLAMMLWSNGGAPQAADQEGPPSFKLRTALAAYLARMQALGRVRADDHELLARMFMGGCLQLVTEEIIVHRRPTAPEQERAYCQALAGQFWRLLAP